jgi:hypothetical protein
LNRPKPLLQNERVDRFKGSDLSLYRFQISRYSLCSPGFTGKTAADEWALPHRIAAATAAGQE